MTDATNKKQRGRPRGVKNKPGHRAGRPRKDGYGAAAPEQDSSLPAGEDPGRPSTTKNSYKSNKVPYRTCADGHNCHGNGNGNGNRTKIPRVNDNPLPNPPAKPLPASLQGRTDVALASVCQSGLNPGIITAEELLLEIQKIATVQSWMFFDEHGAPLPLNKLPPVAAAAISSYSAQPLTYEGRVLMDPRDPEGKTPLYKIHFTLWNKNTAQDQLGKFHGIYAKDREQGRAQIGFQQNVQINQVSRVDLTGYTMRELEVLLKTGLKIEEVNGRPVLDLSPELLGEEVLGSGDQGL